jgi:hypothetical protein
MGMLVHFCECSGPKAKETLNSFARELNSVPGITSLELLQNLEQPQVFLLIIKSSHELDLQPPQGTRVWLFKDSEVKFNTF